MRKPEPEDAERLLAAYAQDPEVTRYLTWAPHSSVEVTKAFIAWCLQAWAGGEKFPYALCLRANGKLIGMVDVRFENPRTVHFGYVLARRFWRQGYMPEAVSALLDLTLAMPEVHRAWSVCDVENYGSRRVLEKVGMQHEGVLRRWMLHPNRSSTPRDCHVFSKVKE